MSEYCAARENAAVFDLSDHGKIELTGRDARKFLHNLSTNDILALTPSTGCEAFLTTPKAKIVAYLWVHRQPAADGSESMWLDTGPGGGERILKYLDHYLISEDVQLADRTGEFAQFHVVGPQAAALLEQVGVTARRHDLLGLPGFDILVTTEEAQSLGQKLAAVGAKPTGKDTFEVLRIEAGTPAYGKEMDEERFVVEVGRGTRAVCYTKGCYLGQEPIVMARDRGHLNRTLVGLKIGGAGSVAAGSKALRDGAEVGQITSAVVSPRLGPIALAYVRRGNWEPGTMLTVDGRTAEVVSLPFGDGS